MSDRPKSGGCLILAFVLAMVLAVIFSQSQDEPAVVKPDSVAAKNESPQPAQTPPPATRTTSDGRARRFTVGKHLAATTPEWLSRGLSLIDQQDWEALAKLSLAGHVFILKEGIEVELVDVKMFSGTVKIRIRGETEEYWTVSEAVK